MPPDHTNVVIGGIIGGLFLILATVLAWLLALRTSRQLKQNEVTAQLMHTWNSVELCVVRYEVLKIAAQFYAGDDSALRLLVNDDFKTYVTNLPAATSNGILAIQNLLIFLYFFVELTANYEMGLVNEKVLSGIFVSQYEFYTQFLEDVVNHYKEVEAQYIKGKLQSTKGAMHRTITPPATPPWVAMLPKLKSLFKTSNP